MGKGLAVSDVIRSMLRLGYTEFQVYEILTGAGVRGEMVQLFMERVLSEMPDGSDKKPKLIAELEEIRINLEELRKEVFFMRNIMAKAVGGDLKTGKGGSLASAHRQSNEKGS